MNQPVNCRCCYPFFTTCRFFLKFLGFKLLISFFECLDDIPFYNLPIFLNFRFWVADILFWMSSLISFFECRHWYPFLNVVADILFCVYIFNLGVELKYIMSLLMCYAICVFLCSALVCFCHTAAGDSNCFSQYVFCVTPCNTMYVTVDVYDWDYNDGNALWVVILV